MEISKLISSSDIITIPDNEFILKNTFSEESNEVEEIISNKPPFLVRWGTVFFLFFLMLIAIICWIIKYPEIIQTTAKLTSINAPKPLIALINGKLINLNIKEDQTVQQGDVLGYMESTADHKEVLQLSYNVDSIQRILDNNNLDKLATFFQAPYTRLGELQLSYQTLSQAFLVFKNYLPNGFYLEKKSMLVKDMSNLKRLRSNLSEQKSLQEQDLALSQKTFDANESLKKDKVISELEYRNEKSKLLNKTQGPKQIASAIISNETQQIDKQKESIELDNTIAQQKIIFQQTLNTFKSQVDDWKKKYLLIAPITGKVAFTSFMQENQQLQVGQTICFINPENSQYFALVNIPQANFGKVAIGQKVLLKFQAYPFQEYGSVLGKIEFISHISTDSGYLAKVSFTNGLNTSYQRQVQYRDGLMANAEIITKDMRLLQRFYYTIVKGVQR